VLHSIIIQFRRCRVVMTKAHKLSANSDRFKGFMNALSLALSNPGNQSVYATSRTDGQQRFNGCAAGFVRNKRLISIAEDNIDTRSEWHIITGRQLPRQPVIVICDRMSGSLCPRSSVRCGRITSSCVLLPLEAAVAVTVALAAASLRH